MSATTTNSPPIAIPEIPQDVQKLLISYLNLRAAIGVCAIGLPITVLSVGALYGIPQQSSISAYYHVEQTRNIFVAALCAIGVFLLTYNGYKSEKYLNKIMGLAAIGVAFFPTSTPSTPRPSLEYNIGMLHNISAVILFLGMTFLSYYWFPKNQSATKDLTSKDKQRNARGYQACALVIAAALVFFAARALIYLVFLRQKIPNDSTLFWVELVSILAFGVAWFIKSHAISRVVKML